MIGDLALGFVVGFVVGVAFFGGLRWTVSRLEHARRPVLLVAVSFLIRVAVVAGAVIAVGRGSLSRVLAAVAGLLVVRTVMVYAVRRRLGATEVAQWT